MEQSVNGKKVPRRILGTLLSALSAGVVPRSGAPYIAIGRLDEIEALTGALERVADGEGSCKFIIGRYGSGKSFLIQLTRGFAMDRGFLTADCDLSPERKLSASGGAGLATYRELVKNLACKTQPDGGALPVIISRWFSQIRDALVDAGQEVDTPEYDAAFGKEIMRTVRALEADVGGFDFATVMREYYNAYRCEDDGKMSACLRWFRGEYNTRTEARSALGMKSLSIIDDDNWYDHLKLITAFARLVGYRGLCVCIDECVNLYKISNRLSRENNYEKILAMFNDTMQGRAPGLMIVFGGTPQFLEDTRRGLFSYEALRSRLSDGRFGGEGLRSLLSPVLRLKRLSDSELLALVMRLTALHGEYHNYKPTITGAQMQAFLTDSLSRAGADTMVTPREIIRDYVTLLDLLLANPDKTFTDITGSMKYTTAAPASSEESPADPVPGSFSSGRSGSADPRTADDTPSGEKPGESGARITIDDLEF
ncbi:MAG: ATP-binding protein [Clostridia bacterium]|nr:ATP-binding protein [Clostridia bacterium]